MPIHRRLLSLIFGLSLITLGTLNPAIAGNRFSSVVVFGDSLSDPGNAWILTHTQSKAPFAIIPDAAYAIGGHHFSNGPTWAEQLAEKLGAPARPAYRFTGGTNFAVGGARAGLPGGANLSEQVGLKLGLSGNVSDPGALYVVAIGGNDVRDAITAYARDGINGSMAVIQNALSSIYQNISSLAQSGAHHFLISTAPDLGLVPAVRLQGPAVQGLATSLSQQFNAGLADTIKLLKQQYGLDVKVLNLYGLVDDIVADPAQFNLQVVDTSCINFGVVAGAICSQPQGYLFWDGIHPTRAGHTLIRNNAYALVAG